MTQQSKSTSFTSALASGSVAGLCVDLTFFPLDTVKTRLQSAQGFWATGGFRGIYSGLGSAAVGSIPGAALFFCTYESVKTLLAPKCGDRVPFLAPLVAASCGEVVGCLVRVPCEVVKQRAQASHSLSSRVVFSSLLAHEGVRGLYRGYTSTVMREVPFSLLQFPLWEALKAHWSEIQGHSVQPWQSSVCGACAGGTAAFLTTPLDVAKTRIMLAEAGTELARGNLSHALRQVYQTKGISGLFAGTSARVLWISAGGAVFLGVYDQSQAIIAQHWHTS